MPGLGVWMDRWTITTTTPHQRIMVSAMAALKSTSPPTLTRSLTAWAVSMPSGPKLKVGVPARVNVAASCQLFRPAGSPRWPSAAAQPSAHVTSGWSAGISAGHDVVRPGELERVLREPRVTGDRLR